jgi:hypothetical protein
MIAYATAAESVSLTKSHGYMFLPVQGDEWSHWSHLPQEGARSRRPPIKVEPVVLDKTNILLLGPTG